MIHMKNTYIDGNMIQSTYETTLRQHNVDCNQLNTKPSTQAKNMRRNITHRERI